MSLTLNEPETLSELVQATARLGDRAAAAALYGSWIARHPAEPQLYIAHFNHACLLSDMGEGGAAMAALNAALALNPDFLPARINLGSLMERAGAPDQALGQWQDVAQRLVAVTGAAITYKVTAMRQMARLLMEHHRLSAAEAVLRQSLDLRPEQRDVVEQLMAVRMSQCAWPVVVGWEGVSRGRLLRGMSPLSLLAYTDDPLMQLGLAHHHAGALVDEASDLSRQDRRDAPIPVGRRLRIGYLSSDLRDHAIGYLMAELFELHDRDRVEVFAYYCGPASSSEITRRTQAAVEHWIDIRNLTDDDAAARIAGDGIDILIDVNGYTRDARTALLARRPAPVQVNWLGYPGTMGTPWHQYIIADDWIIPPAHEAWFSERVLRLPCYQPNDRKRAVGPRPSRAEAGLPVDAFVFCCFNAAQKINAHTLGRWAEILRAVPHGVLWLLDSNEEMRRNLVVQMAARGVAAGRIVFAPRLANPLHLARYPLADLFLDTVPYGAHTTASDALWMGVPVLTLSGRSFASRVCGSLVRAAGTPEMVVERAQDYVRAAIRLAHNPAELAQLRHTLQAQRGHSTLFDMEGLVARLEDLFDEMAVRHRRGETPTPDLTNLDAYLEAGIGFEHEAEEMLLVEDYAGRYRAALARRHAVRQLPADQRLLRQP